MKAVTQFIHQLLTSSKPSTLERVSQFDDAMLTATLADEALRVHQVIANEQEKARLQQFLSQPEHLRQLRQIIQGTQAGQPPNAEQLAFLESF